MTERNPFKKYETNSITEAEIESLLKQTKSLDVGDSKEIFTTLNFNALKKAMKRIGKFDVIKSDVDASLWVKRLDCQTETGKIERLIDSNEYHNYIPISLNGKTIGTMRSIIQAIAKKRMYKKIKTKASSDGLSIMIKVVK